MEPSISGGMGSWRGSEGSMFGIKGGNVVLERSDGTILDYTVHGIVIVRLGLDRSF